MPALATPGLAVPGGTEERDIKVGLELAEVIPSRRGAGAAELEREEVTGEDLVLDHEMDCVMDHVTDHVMDHAMDHVTDHAMDHVMDHVTDLLSMAMDEGEVGTEDTEGEGAGGVGRREAGEDREASQPGVRAEEEGEEGDGVAGSRGRPSTSTAW